MRFAERSIRLAWLAIGAIALAGCESFGRKPEPPAPAAAPAAAAKPAQSAPVAATPEPPPVNPAVQRAFDAARQALAAGRTAEAERGFVALTKSNPELAGPHANLGLIHRQAGRPAEAVAALEKAVQLSPQRAELHNQLGIAYRTAGDFAKAKAAYERAIELHATYAAAVLNLGILYDLYLWDGARALELYDRYMQLAGSDEQVKRWISDLRNRNPQKSVAQRKEQG
jgi:Flp pilus assembly protein TadD